MSDTTEPREREVRFLLNNIDDDEIRSDAAQVLLDDLHERMLFGEDLQTALETAARKRGLTLRIPACPERISA